MARPKKITAAVLNQIPMLIDRGLSASEIACRVGCTIGTLRVTCSKSKISLRRKNFAESGKLPAKQAGDPHLVTPGVRRNSGDGQATMSLQLPETTVRLLRQKGMEKGLAAPTLAGMLLEMVVQDSLYDAVLDREHETQAA